MLGAGFKNLKGLCSMLGKRFPALPDAEPPLEALPYITHQTVSYALSLFISCVCYAYNDTMIKGRPDQLYEKIIAGYSEQCCELRHRRLLHGDSQVQAH